MSMLPNCELDGASIVLLGDLNPRIFQPRWLAAKGVIRSREAEEADIKIISSQISVFSADWLTLQVTRERFAASTSDPLHFEPLRDFVQSVFKLLEHTPLKQMGINRDMHYRVESLKKWHAVGHLLAPKDIWEDLMQQPGLETLAIGGRRPGSPAKLVRVTVQPSRRMPAGAAGVYFGANEHFESEGDDSTQNLLSMLGENWRGAMDYAKRAAERILTDKRLGG